MTFGREPWPLTVYPICVAPFLVNCVALSGLRVNLSSLNPLALIVSVR